MVRTQQYPKHNLLGRNVRLLLVLLTYTGDRARAMLCRFRSSQSEFWQTVRVVPRDSYSLTVHGLRHRTRYQFMLLARDQYGTPHFSRVVNAMTTRLNSEPDSIIDHPESLSFLGFCSVTFKLMSYHPGLSYEKLVYEKLV